MRFIVATAALALATPVSAATLSYSFTTDEPFAGGTVAFTYEPAGAIPFGTFIQRDALATATPGLARIRLTDSCSIFVSGVGNTGCDLVEAIVNTSFGSTQIIRYFADGAFSTPGTYSALTGAAATFTVTAANAVPEPAAWAMLILGAAGIGAALRSRRRAVFA